MLVKVFDVGQGRLNPTHFEVLKLWNCSLRLWLPWLEPSVSCSKLSIYDSTAQLTSQNVPFGTFKSGAARSALQNFINHIGPCARANKLPWRKIFLNQNDICQGLQMFATVVLKPCCYQRVIKTKRWRYAAQIISTLWTALPLLHICSTKNWTGLKKFLLPSVEQRYSSLSAHINYQIHSHQQNRSGQSGSVSGKTVFSSC